MKILLDNEGVVCNGEENIADAIENLEPNGSWTIIEN